jgi:hypothetical protein
LLELQARGEPIVGVLRGQCSLGLKSNRFEAVRRALGSTGRWKRARSRHGSGIDQARREAREFVGVAIDQLRSDLLELG